MIEEQRRPHAGAPQPGISAGERWQLSMGATVVAGGVEFRVWAPAASQIDVVLDGADVALSRDADDVWSGFVGGIGAGGRYRYRVDGGGAFSDPHSRSQPEGPHGPSEVIDPRAYTWHDGGWKGLRASGLVIYECHVGSYSEAGTFDALAGDLDNLRDLGITAIEIMPIADFPGTRNWGYDGVNLFAPSRNYGGPDALRRFVDEAHKRGIGVILDVVYNHFGPDGNYLLQYSPDYLTDRHKTPWGDAINFDGTHSDRVRRYIIDNANYWISEFHLDGLRLDATFAIIDDSPRHILADLTDSVRANLPPGRGVVLIAETYENDPRYVRPTSEGGLGFDAVWADDFHHVVHTAASAEQVGYYADYDGTMDELARTINRGWLFEGQVSRHLKEHRGAPSDAVQATNLVYFIQNHDQVGNRAFGRRFAHLVGAAVQKPWSALHVLLPYTPMLFMGQEFVTSSRFYYFTDHNEELGREITEGRRREFASFSGFEAAALPDPQDDHTFLDSKLNLEEREQGVGAERFALNRELIALRKKDRVLRRQDRRNMRAVAASDSMLLVHMWHGREHRLIVANFGVAVDAPPSAAGVPEGLANLDWRVVVSTEERRFGGIDDQARFDEHMVALPPQAVLWLAATSPSAAVRAFRFARSAVRAVRSRVSGG
ncbi:MAG: malto-oligosyltrehalose trehalohydrolase [Dehalococcoidia bacterium]